MESLLIINSVLVAICMYFIRDFHKDFKETSKKVDQLEMEIKIISIKMGLTSPTEQEK